MEFPFVPGWPRRIGRLQGSWLANLLALRYGWGDYERESKRDGVSPGDRCAEYTITSPRVHNGAGTLVIPRRHGVEPSRSAVERRVSRAAPMRQLLGCQASDERVVRVGDQDAVAATVTPDRREGSDAREQLHRRSEVFAEVVAAEAHVEPGALAEAREPE